MTSAGAVTATGGLIALVYGLLEAARHPWGSSQVLVPLLGGVTLLAAMVVIEARSDAPLIPLRFFASRTRAVANFVSLFSSAAFFSYVFLMTLFEQQVSHIRRCKGGRAPPARAGDRRRHGDRHSADAAARCQAAISLELPRRRRRAAAHQPDSGRELVRGGALPGMVVIAVSFGLGFAPIMNAALHRVTGQDSSLASGLQGSVQQVGAERSGSPAR